MTNGRRSRAAGRGTNAISAAAQPALERLERAWLARLQPFPELAPLVTGQALREEPRHRWLTYRQGFAPELVRAFLRETDAIRRELGDGPVLDPFCGVGTAPLECARNGVAAIGVEGMPWLAFLAAQKAALSVPRYPDLSGCLTPADVARRVVEPIHRAALLYAVARQHSATGVRLVDAPELAEQLRDILHVMRADCATPLSAEMCVKAGDARRLTGIPNASVAAVLTSPPYFSRHEYLGNTRPIAEVFALWDDASTLPTADATQIRAQRRGGRGAHVRAALPEVVEEAGRLLRQCGATRLAAALRSYFDDLRQALGELARVLKPGGVGWLIVGGARVRSVLIASDLALAVIAEGVGLIVDEVRVTREVSPDAPVSGRLAGVNPRESIIVFRRPSALA